jgi:hypothetical protein
MRIFCVVVATGVLSGLSVPTLADAQSYCGLYGRDYADGKSPDVDQWQISYHKAFSSCMTLYTPDPSDTPKSKSDEKAIRKVALKPTQETPRRKRTRVLAPRSVAWNEYCAAKYTSFNKATGKYKSYSGKAKPCLVRSG